MPSEQELFIATAAERDRLIADHQRLARLNVNQNESSPEDQIRQTPDVHVALTPCGSTIPALTFSTAGVPEPGTLLCCLFKLGFKVGADINNVERTITPVLNPDGSAVRVQVYNIYEAEVPDRVYFKVDRNKFGNWLNENPAPALEGTTTGDPATSTTTTGAPVPTPCSGKCKWTWSSSTRLWTQTTDNCATTTTAVPTTTTTAVPTTSTTSGGSTTSTTGIPTTTTTPCPCPVLLTTTTIGPGSTTSTTSTTTTTAAPVTCHCLYPGYCGLVDGECTSTFCAVGTASAPVACPTTTTTAAGTTTTCDCNLFTTTTGNPATSTTTTENPNCTGCTYYCRPVLGWLFTEYNCGGCLPSNGFCCASYPNSNSAGLNTGICCTPPEDYLCNPNTYCTYRDVECAWCTPGTTTTPAPFCGGTCVFWWLTGPNVWQLTEATCNPPGGGCFCSPPSQPGNSCAPVVVGCQTPVVIDPPPVPCSVNCTSTTGGPTTTTTPAPCSTCRMYWNTFSLQWMLVSGCSGNCYCRPPSYDGSSCATGNEYVMSICLPITTTTTTSAPTTSTTTTTPSPCTDSSCTVTYNAGTASWDSTGCLPRTECECFQCIGYQFPEDPTDGQIVTFFCCSSSGTFGEPTCEDQQDLCPPSSPCCDSGVLGGLVFARFSNYTSGALECGPLGEGDSTPTVSNMNFDAGSGKWLGTFTPAGSCASDTETTGTQYDLAFYCQDGDWKLDISGPCGNTYTGINNANDCSNNAAFEIEFDSVIYAKCSGGDCTNGCRVDIKIKRS